MKTLLYLKTLHKQCNEYTMIQYSDQETKLFQTRFGRVELPMLFNDWDQLKADATKQQFQFVRLRISNPKSAEIDHILSLGKKASLLEILRTYTFKYDPGQLIPINHDGLSFIKVHEENKVVFKKMLEDSYEDIPFGNYTPASVLQQFPLPLQYRNLHDYFMDNYTGQDKSNIAYVITDPKGTPVGCITLKNFEKKLYSYYVGIVGKYRNMDVLNKSINFLQHLTRELHKDTGEGSARLSNLYSQRAFEKNNMKCTGYDQIYLLEF